MNEKLLDLNPDDILIKENARYSLHPYRIERLAEEIIKDGGVNTPVEVQKLKTPENGKTYLLTVGHYRHAAVSKLNSEQKAGLTLPARVVPIENEAARTLRQVSENNERENMSPMDKAVAMQKLFSAGLSKMDVRKAFSVPGGRKGLKIAPASNSHVNMTLSFLDFPKDIQKKIHDGTIGSGAAYELTKYPRDKWEPMLTRIESEREKEITAAEKAEEKYLKEQKELETQQAVVNKITEEYTTIKETADKAAAVAAEKTTNVAAAFQGTIAKGLDKDSKKKATEHFKAAQAEAKAAEEASGKAARELAKLEEKRQSIAEKAEAAKKRLEEARNNKAAAGKVSGKDVKKAAKEVGASTKPVALNATEMREACKSLSLLSGPKSPNTKLVGQLLIQCFDGIINDAQLQLGVARLLGEAPPVKLPPPPAAKK